ncbi:MAG: hypothetical protein HPY53_01435 [Brevinematales bacterium]|nr:hypothetical protein [Brevinematales bacterium]
MYKVIGFLFMMIAVFVSIVNAGPAAKKAKINAEIKHWNIMDKYTGDAYFVNGVELSRYQYVDYEFYKKEPGVGVFMNLLLPGFGLGNVILGDNDGALIQIVGWSSSVFVAVTGAAIDKKDPGSQIGKVIEYAGIAGLGFFIVRGIISSFTFCADYNDKLLELVKNGTISYNKDGLEINIYQYQF